MSGRVLRYQPSDGATLRAGFDVIRKHYDVPAGFPEPVMREAEDVAQRNAWPGIEDQTDIEFVTIDPPGSMDLDQALHITRRTGAGYRIHYAIADVASFVRPGGAIDNEANERGATLYMPDGRAPLHPVVISEGRASLLPGEDRPALLWTIDLDSSGEQVAVDVRRAVVRSRARFTYAEVQRSLDADTAAELFVLLREVGRLREERAVERGAVWLPTAEQTVVEEDGSYSLVFRAPLPVEGWNAEISMLTGMAAAELMLYGEIGIVRTLPEPSDDAVKRLRKVARALDIDWPDKVRYPEMIRNLDVTDPRQAALLQEATALLRGSGYAAFAGGVPELATHAALAAEYAHVTAPLRRLADRYAGEICVALCAGREVPEWVRTGLPALPGVMERAAQKASAVEGACVSYVEAVLLSGAVGETFDGVVLDLNDDGDGGVVQLADPAVRGRIEGPDLRLGRRIRVRLVEADVEARQIRFAPA